MSADVKDRALEIGDKLCEVEQLVGLTAGQVIRAGMTGGHTAASVACLNVSKLRHLCGELSNLCADFEKSLR